MILIYGDFETKSAVSLKIVGTMRYAEHPSTDILCIGVQIGKIKYRFRPNTIKYLKSILEKYPGAIYVFHNAYFDRNIWNEILHKRYGFLHLPIERTRCTMAKCYANGLPGSLEKAAALLELPISKDMGGRDNMLTLSKPRKNGNFWTEEEKPDRFKKLEQYCITDVEVMKLIDESLPDLSEIEQQTWFIDQRINQEGIYVDIPTIKTALQFNDLHDEAQQKRFNEITGGDPDSSRRRAKLLEWLNNKNIKIDNTRKATLTGILAQSDLDPEIKDILTICTTAGKTSVAKYSKMLVQANEAGNISGILQYHGAHTGRWAGRGIQIQNFPKAASNTENVLTCLLHSKYDEFTIQYPDISTGLSCVLRRIIVAPPGKSLIGADFTQIEARVVAWLAGQHDALEVFKSGQDPYCVEASKIYGQLITKQNKDQRSVGKVAVLALGFGGGIGAFVKMSVNNGLNLKPAYDSLWSTTTQKERDSAEWSYNEYRKRTGVSLPLEIGLVADLIKQRWRKGNPNIKSYWADIEESVRTTIQTRRGVEWRGVSFYIDNKFLRCVLPSGRIMSYFNPEILDNNSIGYTIINIKKQVEVVATYGGELVENIVQAVARDIMRDAMIRIEPIYPTAFTVHDELVSVTDIPNLKLFEDLVSTVPTWATGLPIGVECWKGDRYGK